MKKFLLILMCGLLVACKPEVTTEPKPYFVAQDIESCKRQPELKWCQITCDKHPSMEWCDGKK